MPTLHLHPLSKLLFENLNPLKCIQQEYNVGTSDSSYLKLEHLFLGYKLIQYNLIQGLNNLSKFWNHSKTKDQDKNRV